MNKKAANQKPRTASRPGAMWWMIAAAVAVAGVFAVGKFRSSPSSKPAPASQKSGEAAEGSPFIPTFPNKAPAPGLAPEAAES
jgi:hypothetical protein